MSNNKNNRPSFTPNKSLGFDESQISDNDTGGGMTATKITHVTFDD